MIKPLVATTIAIISLAVSGAHCEAQLQFNTNSVNDVDADAAIQAATNNWAVEFEDNITVNVNFSFANLGAGAIATSSNATQSNTYVAFRNALTNDVRSVDDLTTVSGLSTGSTFSVYINRTSEATGVGGITPYVDDDGGANNSNVVLTTANAKALGLRSATDTASDGAIVFNSGVPWDFDPSDGITPGTLDFVGVATHEIGHTLGFESGVDDLDSLLFNTGGIGSIGGTPSISAPDDNDLAFVTPLDFLRFSDDSVIAGADIDWTADTRDKFYSIDGGLTAAIGGTSHWSTGFNFGDGQEASHWRNGAGIGILNPVATAGASLAVSATDVQAFDVIGFDRVIAPVPEPSSSMLMLLGAGALFFRRRR